MAKTSSRAAKAKPAARKKTEGAKTQGRRKKAAEPLSRGLAPKDVAAGEPPAELRNLIEAVEADGGAVLARYRDPLGGHWQLLVALPIDQVEPTPFQRNLSEAHAKLLARRIDELGRFLDPIIVVRHGERAYWTPNGYHRLTCLRQLGARTVTALLVPEEEIAYRILALNTEKAHNLREKALEVIRMARELARLDPRPEKDFAPAFEEPALLTLGLCYDEKGNFAGGVYQPVLKRVESFLDLPLPRALEVRAARARQLFELDEAVAAAVAALKERGFESPYLKNFVVARINPLRFQKGEAGSFDEVIGKMLAAARRFDAAKVKADQLARAGGPAEE